jgi:hypothetical protein
VRARRRIKTTAMMILLVVVSESVLDSPAVDLTVGVDRAEVGDALAEEVGSTLVSAGGLKVAVLVGLVGRVAAGGSVTQTFAAFNT